MFTTIVSNDFVTRIIMTNINNKRFFQYFSIYNIENSIVRNKILEIECFSDFVGSLLRLRVFMAWWEWKKYRKLIISTMEISVDIYSRFEIFIYFRHFFKNVMFIIYLYN